MDPRIDTDVIVDSDKMLDIYLFLIELKKI